MFYRGGLDSRVDVGFGRVASSVLYDMAACVQMQPGRLSTNLDNELKRFASNM